MPRWPPPRIYIPLCFYFIPIESGLVRLIPGNLHSTMLLLYPAYSSSEISPLFDLHSTMLLLYPHTDNRWSFYHVHLHSTMLLLYPIQMQSDISSDSNLHSTMLLLYHKLPSPLHPDPVHLHSTMLLLYLSWRVYFGNAWNIYIPLCFYFIELSLYDAGQSKTFTFHYASTLSTAPSSVCSTLAVFTFHYASTLSGSA